MLISKFCRI